MTTTTTTTPTPSAKLLSALDALSALLGDLKAAVTTLPPVESADVTALREQLDKLLQRVTLLEADKMDADDVDDLIKRQVDKEVDSAMHNMDWEEVVERALDNVNLSSKVEDALDGCDLDTKVEELVKEHLDKDTIKEAVVEVLTNAKITLD